MNIVFSGTCSHDPDRGCVDYEASVDGACIECEIADSSLSDLFEDMGDPLSTFISARLAVIELTGRILERKPVPRGLRLAVSSLGAPGPSPIAGAAGTAREKLAAR